jgi:6-phosphofructo-2-kinase/fructose-2,6-biphosphatase
LLGESYKDVIERLQPIIIELERLRCPVLIIAHQAILRVLYSYFVGSSPDDVPHHDMPLHNIIELDIDSKGVQVHRFDLTPQVEAAEKAASGLHHHQTK